MSSDAAAATDLMFRPADELAGMVRSGELSARELVQASLDRIEELNPKLNAFIDVFADEALAAADGVSSGDERPLAGVPIAIKNNRAVEGKRLTFAAELFGDFAAPYDHNVVRRFKEAGAIVVGTTTLPELGIQPATETRRFGATRNPWDLGRTPGGSSGGAAAAVAAGMVPLAHGNDGGGSIRIPAACCGLVGLKPQRGRVPTAPLVDPWHGLSVFGALTRTVADTALVGQVLSGQPWAAAAAREPGRLRIALSFAVARESRATVAPEVRRATEDVAETLRTLGHEVVERDPDLGTAGLGASARYLVGIRDDARAIAHPERLEPRTKAMARLGRLVGDRGLRWAHANEPAHAARVNAIFADVDVVLTPTLAGPPLPVGSSTGHGALRTMDQQARWAPPFTAVWNHTGNPAISVPAGLGPDGLPLAVQLAGPFEGEERLLALASQLEAARPWAARRPGLAA
jgi:amidase